MIGSLRGTLVSKRPPWLTLDVGGVGYELEAPMSTFYRLPDTGRELMLVTHLVVREDAHALYGFFTEAERALFRALLKISGVGPRIALGVLSGMTVEGFYQCIRDQNVASLVKVPGVGQKTAELLLLKMKDRLPESLETERAAIPARSQAEGEAERRAGRTRLQAGRGDQDAQGPRRREAHDRRDDPRGAAARASGGRTMSGVSRAHG